MDDYICMYGNQQLVQISFYNIFIDSIENAGVMLNIHKIALKVLFACMVTLSIAPAFANTAPDLQPPSKAKPSYLFAISIQNVELTQAETKTDYKLVMPIKNIKSVLMFTDRPNRFATYIKPDFFAKIIHKKDKDSFDEVPPNIAISFSNKYPPIAFSISQYSKNDTELQYTLKLLKPLVPPKGGLTYHGDITIVYDDLWTILLDSVGALFECYFGFEAELLGAVNSGTSADVALETHEQMGSAGCQFTTDALNGTITTEEIKTYTNSGGASI